MSEWLKEHAWKLIPLARADAHQIPPTHFRSTTSRNNDLLQRVPVNDGIAPGFRGICDTVLTQNAFPVIDSSGFQTPAPGPYEAMTQRNRPRVLLADDDAEIAAAVSRLLSFSCDVIGCVRDVDTLLDSVMRLRPDVVLLDFSLRGRLNPLQACRLMQAMTPQVRTVAFTADNDPVIRRAAYDAGASGFVWKMQVATDLLPAIQAAVDTTSRPSKDNSA